jgi:hypothetical protein
MTDAIFDIRRDQYATALRELLRHENDLTNHRIMWLLVGQGFIANAFVANNGSESMKFGLQVVGILLTLSAFVMLYKSYQARGYIEFLGNMAKEGTLSEECLPLMGWPRIRISGWRRKIWACPWIRQPDDVLEPWSFLPVLFIFMWMTGLIHGRTRMGTGTDVLIAITLTVAILSVYCGVVVHYQVKEEESTAEVARIAQSRLTGTNELR